MSHPAATILVLLSDLIHEAGKEAHEGADQVRGGGGHKQPTLMADEVQAGLYQPLEELRDELSVLFRDGVWEGVHIGLH